MTKRPEGSELTSRLLHFLQLMKTKLRENNHKGSWLDVSVPFLMVQLLDEVEELRKDVLEKNWGPRGECTDVANLAFMIADRLRKD